MLMIIQIPSEKKKLRQSLDVKEETMSEEDP
jgi:hypothetical protein